LALFAADSNKALTREFIEKQIWKDSELYSNSRALDVHIQRLRKKIEKAPDNPEYIVTIPGVGYKLNVTK
ncbi:MAG: winged helix-turn-helix domain-containing protein, partial [Desulfobacteraceae bacterium]|nr:winged helix-turn-helix domain-containing protein [Desulfobacteraceae bacterium]